jgi:hypothetical protein
LTIALATYVPATGQGVDFDAIAALPGAQTTTTKSTDGSEVTEVKLPNGVVFHRERRNGETSTYGADLSGHGAVMCAWRIYNGLAAALESCPEYRNEPLKADLADAIDRINDFIVANSLSPVTKAELERTAAAAMKENVPRLCQSGDLAGMLKSAGLAHDRFMSSVADLLSIPRPPVTNPCL